MRLTKAVWVCCGPLISVATPTMPIAPITGMLRKRFWLDISTGLGLGLSAGAAFWSVSSLFHR
jgi:hypothetical protein